MAIKKREKNRSSATASTNGHRNHVISVGRRVAELRAKRGISQVALASKVQCKQGTISRMENGENVKIETLVRVVDALGCTILIEEASQNHLMNRDGATLGYFSEHR